MKKLLTILVGCALLVQLLPLYNAAAQDLPRVPADILKGLTGYTTSYISGGPYGGHILVAGGVRDSVYQNDVLLYDPDTGESEIPEEGTLHMGAPRAFHTATTLSDGRILFFGGESSATTYVSLAELFDPVTFSFIPLSISAADLPHPQRKQHAATFFYILGNPEQYVLITGGCTETCTDTLRDSIIYRVSDDMFMAGPLMQQGHKGHQATYLPAAGGRGVVMLMGHGQPEYFDIDSFNETPGSGKFVQDATVQALIDENQVLLNAGKAVQQTAVFNKVPQAVTDLLEKSKTPAVEDTDALKKQLDDLDRLQRSINSLRVPSVARSVVARDGRGNVMVSGDTASAPVYQAMSTGTGSSMDSSRATILAQQDKIARMLRGDFSETGAGGLLPSAVVEEYETRFSAFQAGLSGDMSELLSSLMPEGRDSDGDGISDQAERDVALDPFKADTDGDGFPDMDAFVGTAPVLGRQQPAWPSQLTLLSVCANDGAVWGRALPGAEVGLFQQSTSGTRFQLTKGLADSRGVFVLPVSAPVSEGMLSLVLRTQQHDGSFAYSDPLDVRVTACLPSEIVMMDAVTVSYGQRLVSGRSAPGSFVFLALPGSTYVTLTDAEGRFTAQLDADLSAGQVAIKAWSVLHGASSNVRTYTLDVPLQPTGSGSLLGDVSVRSSAPVETSSLFWWLYILGLVGGVTALTVLAFDLRRRYVVGNKTLSE